MASMTYSPEIFAGTHLEPSHISRRFGLHINVCVAIDPMIGKRIAGSG